MVRDWGVSSGPLLFSSFLWILKTYLSYVGTFVVLSMVLVEDTLVSSLGSIDRLLLSLLKPTAFFRNQRGSGSNWVIQWRASLRLRAMQVAFGFWWRRIFLFRCLCWGSFIRLLLSQ